MKFNLKLAGILILAGFYSYYLSAQTATMALSSWAFDTINIPESTLEGENSRAIIVAVIDDAFRLSHKELKDFIYLKPSEKTSNQLDDDGNGFIDDFSGWDISDNDHDVSIPEGREKVFFHGTYVASIITKTARLYYGENASARIKIMPVKVLSDQSQTTYLKDGYKGIKYAMENGADIICCAWSGGNPGDEDLKIIQEANAKGILIVSSAGNFNEEKIFNPANVPGVIAVAGIARTGLKQEFSNYGMRTDISAPAEQVSGAHPEKDNAYISEEGTSAAAALVSGCAAILLSENSALKNSEIKEALLNSSSPFSTDFSQYGGKMGAGILNLGNALEYLSTNAFENSSFSALRSKASIRIRAENADRIWNINPAGSYYGFNIVTDVSQVKNPAKHAVRFFLNDTLWNEYTLSNIPASLFVPSPSLEIRMEESKWRKKDLLHISYSGKTIDSTTLYCDGLRYLNLEKGSLADGSDENNYANNCSCRWIIKVPAGKRIKFTFDKMDTEAKVDFVYLVDGQTAIPQNIIAKFSGSKLPPIVVSRTNEVLVWFVTDAHKTAEGWQLHYEAVE